MSRAILRVIHAGPLVSIQDGGRFGHMRFGVSASGPMDRSGFAVANTALGQRAGATGIEVSLGGLVLECRHGAVSIAVAGGGFAVDFAGTKSGSWTVQTLHQGERLSIRGGAWGSWAYLAFAGDLKSQNWLGHSATHSMSGFGGGALKAGQDLEIEDAETRDDRSGDIPCPAFAKPDGTARVVIGPQDQHFSPVSVETFLSTPYKLTDAFDRMGVRLSGPVLELSEALSIPSEPILRGSVQVSGDGVPTVLLADHQTTGGYPKIATVISADLDRLSQMRAQGTIRFAAITPEEAIAATRAEAQAKRDYLAELAKPRPSLSERLLRENLIGGVTTGGED
ncbi:biotin-dependent carboxyltransferase family protein [Litoreibacter janthinus]|uniref:Allophanate hydrolase n=1 Tax=Litoreibacter janthinus TaxID=670154 RepID=A0A1I6GKZ1_9RHOB|nr:biotin-dependent carboxyltransferase family protein [Litoreibacter janthinus]SFR42864.1 allophanate hydrolase [Litoreibacter janthinus]